MKNTIMRKGIRFILFITLLLVHVSVFAAEFPTGPITIINPQPPGGSRDVLSRAFASVAEKFLGQPVVVVNKPGATGMIGGLAGTQAPPDGYTLTAISSNDWYALAWEVANGRNPAYTMNDFIPIGAFTVSPTLVAVPYDSPWKTMADLIRDSKAKPGYYAFSSGGMYGIDHISVELLSRALGLKFRQVPTKGGGPALNALIGGHVHFSTPLPPSSIPLARGGKLRFLAVQGDTRYKAIPDIPTVKELGIDAECYMLTGIYAPKKIPMPVAERLRSTLEQVIKDKKFIEVIENLGDELHPMSGDEVVKYFERDSERIAKLMSELAKEAQKK